MRVILAYVRRYLASAWKSRWKALAFAWFVCLLSWAGATLIPDRYQATARVSADADAVMSVLLKGIAIESSPGRQVELLHRTLLNRRNLERLIDETALKGRLSAPDDREVYLQRLAREIRITQPTRNIFTIEYSDRDPQVAFEMVDLTLKLFLDAVALSERQQMESARAFLSEQLEFYLERLREAGRVRFEFVSRYGDLLPGPNGAVSRIEAVRTQLQTARGELADARSRRDLTKRQLDIAPQILANASEGGVAPAAAPSTMFSDAERQLRELRLRFTEQHPDVIIARQLVATLQASGAGFATQRGGVGRLNPLYEQLKVRLVDAEARVSALERQVEETQDQLARLEGLAKEETDPLGRFAALDRDYGVLRKNYEELLSRREALQIADAARSAPERTKVEVVDAPKVPRLPIGPYRRLLYAAGLGLGLAAGATLAVGFARFDRAFYTLEDLRRIGLPVIGGISAVGLGRDISFSAVSTFALACLLLLASFGAVMMESDRLVSLSRQIPKMELLR